MPKVDEFQGFSVSFYANEHLPKHVHFRKGGGQMVKINIEKIEVVNSINVSKQMEKVLLKRTELMQKHYLHQWNSFFKNKPDLL
ncbi:MAG: DUF4160 domain-containing protein [Streptococcaceae bacterium]|jgi:hypothetical protein|nr:DUF4160 domain-containing protein [Streptococcaceae bacterium]